MSAYRNILVIVDPTAHEQPAVDKAAILAAKFAARLELFVCDTQSARESRLFAQSLKGAHPFDAKALVETIAVPLRAKGLDVTTEVAWTESLDAGLVARVCRGTADLVVKDTHHHSLAQRTFLSNTDWQLIRGCTVPLLLTKQTAWSAAPRLIAAIDPEHVNDKPAQLDRVIMTHASQLTDALSGDLHVLHAYLPAAIAASATAAPLGGVFVSEEDLRQEREARMDSVKRVTDPWHIDDAHIHLELGGPAATLPLAADNLHADVIVMGAVSRRGLKRVLMGSTAEDVLERLPCDALIVKPPGFADRAA